MASEEFCPKRILERELLAGNSLDTTKANEKFSPKRILEKEFLAGMDTNGASLDDLWKDAPLWKKQWCVWSASQAVLSEVTGQLLEEHGEEQIAPLLQNPPFTDEVFPGKYEASTSLTRERVRSTCPLNEATDIPLHNRLLRSDIDPLTRRAQQVEALLQLEGGTEFRVSTSCSTKDNSDDTNTALPTAATTTTTPAAATSFATTSASAVTSTTITASAATPTTASAVAVLPPAAAFTPSSVVATAIEATSEGNIDDAFAIAAAAGITYGPFKKEDAVPAAASAAATNAFDTASASADLFDASAASACTGCTAVYDFYFKYSGEEEETHPYLYNNNKKLSSSLYNNNNNKPSYSLYNNNNNKPSSSLYNNNSKPSSFLYNNNNKASSFYNNIIDPRLVGFLANKMESQKRKRNGLEVDGFYLKRLSYDNKQSCSLYDNNTKSSSSLYNNSNDPRLAGFSAHKMDLKKRKRDELQDDGFYLKRLRYD